MPDRRSVIVLSSLVGAMTLVSALLLILEPSPMRPLTGIMTLGPVDETGPHHQDRLFDTSPAGDRWQAIVIHDSGSRRGSATSINRIHEAAGLGGLGYHFVLGNGQGLPDGEIEAGFRWWRQLDGAHTGGENGQWYNEHAIGICLVGNGDEGKPTADQMRQLVWLVQRLQRRFDIEPRLVAVQYGRAPSSSRFPRGEFQQQLLN